VVLFGGASLQQVGIVYTTAGKAGFITGLYVVIVPILGLLWRQVPRAAAWLGAVLAAVGLYLLSVTGPLTLAKGDALVLGCAVMFAAHVVIIGWLTRRTDSLQLAILQFAVCSALSLAVAILAEEITLASLVQAAVPILYGGLLSTGVAYTLQVVAQKDAPSTHAAIILSLESVFAAIGGCWLLGEVIPGRGLLGCGLMLGGALISQLYGKSREEKRG
jgi:drug/metabolite transporter (DMT)-like permease